MQRLLAPATLQTISGLELVAKTVVDGFISGLHRSPDFGFSQEFAEYRSYNPGDDLRHVDWNVAARTGKMFLKRFRGETNTQLTVLLDASASMSFGSQPTTKLDYAKFLAAALTYMAHQQRDAMGVMLFDDELRALVPPSSRQGQLHRVMHVLDEAQAGTRTNYEAPFVRMVDLLRRRGIVVVISDFFVDPQECLTALTPFRLRGNEVVLFHLLDPEELRPKIDESVMMVDMETGQQMEVSPGYIKNEYSARIDGHVAALRAESQKAGIDYLLVPTDKPLDAALREYLHVRQGRM